jgi:seryl-tRNA synthetase
MFDHATTVQDDLLPLSTEAAGVYLFGESFEAIIGMLRKGIAAMATAEPFRRLTIPPVISRGTIEKAGYVGSFPQLLGTVHSYRGDDRSWGRLAPLVESGGDWYRDHEISDVVLLPAACYPVYPTLAGRELTEPARFHVEATCFRNEASSEIGRLRSFRMVELVTAGAPGHCSAWRERWLNRVAEWLTALRLEVAVEVADDPFFGPGRKLYQEAQRLQELKFELRVPVSGDVVQAIASANYHKEHFGEAFGFTGDGVVGHTACTAFGMERIALALINVHGPDPERWPGEILAVLG